MRTELQAPVFYHNYDVASGSDIMSCFKFNKPPVVSDFGNVMK